VQGLLRKKFLVIESFEMTIEIIDVKWTKSPLYLTVGKTPFERGVESLSKPYFIRVSKERGLLF
jgi:hypothetical protein